MTALGFAGVPKRGGLEGCVPLDRRPAERIRSGATAGPPKRLLRLARHITSAAVLSLLVRPADGPTTRPVATH